MKLKLFLILSIKINLKLIKDLNIRSETIKILDENLGKICLTLVLAVNFWIPHQKQTNINKYDNIKLKYYFCKTKETKNKMKRQPID